MTDGFPKFSSYDIIQILEAAQRTGVLAMKFGDVEFQRHGYEAPAEATTPTQEIIDEAKAHMGWLSAEPPASPLGPEKE